MVEVLACVHARARICECLCFFSWEFAPGHNDVTTGRPDNYDDALASLLRIEIHLQHTCIYRSHQAFFLQYLHAEFIWENSTLSQW